MQIYTQTCRDNNEIQVLVANILECIQQCGRQVSPFRYESYKPLGLVAFLFKCERKTEQYCATLAGKTQQYITRTTIFFNKRPGLSVEASQSLSQCKVSTFVVFFVTARRKSDFEQKEQLIFKDFTIQYKNMLWIFKKMYILRLFQRHKRFS